jgi:putative transcriptional regulator
MLIRQLKLGQGKAQRRSWRPAKALHRAPLGDVTRALCAFLLLFGMSWPTSADDTKPLTTILLVARAELPDSNFKDSVVLVTNNIGPAPAGVIINRPTRIAVSRLFPDLERLAQLDDKLYFGGPVETASVAFVFRADTPPEHATQVLDGIYFSRNGELLRKLLGRDKPMDGLRIFIGHSGWAPGQLEAEIARGDWTLAPAETDAIFDGKSEHPWPEQQAPDAVHRT